MGLGCSCGNRNGKFGLGGVVSQMWPERSGRGKRTSGGFEKRRGEEDANRIRQKRHEFYFHTLSLRSCWNIQLQTVAGKWEDAVTAVEVGLGRMSFGVL